MQGHGVDERAAIARLQRGDIAGLEPFVRAHQARATGAAGSVAGRRSAGWRLMRIDTGTNQVAQQLPLAIVPHDLALAGDTLWVAGQERPTRSHDRRLVRIDTGTGATVATIPLPSDGVVHVAAAAPRI